MTTHKPLWLTVAPAAFLCLWSGGYVAAKYGLNYAEPMTFLSLRYAIVVVTMLVLFVVIKPPLPVKVVDWVHLAIVGFLIQSLYFGMCYLAFRTGIAVGILALLLSMQPVLVGLVAPRWAGENVGWRRWCGLLLGLAGAVVVITARSEIAPPTAFALLCALIGLLGITGGSLWEKRFGLSHHPVTSNLIVYTAGLLGVAPFMFWLESMQIDWTWEFAASLTYLVIGNSIVAIGLLLAMIRAGDVSRVSALFFLIPPMAALVAWLLLGEVIAPQAWLGIAIAALGVFLATRN